MDNGLFQTKTSASLFRWCAFPACEFAMKEIQIFLDMYYGTSKEEKALWRLAQVIKNRAKQKGYNDMTIEEDLTYIWRNKNETENKPV